jgi:uncharacterized protein YdaU (DUF1376 family)
MRAKDKSRLPWFKFFAGDFLTQTVDSSTAERGCYVSLLANYWLNGPLPHDLSKLIKIAGLDYHERPAWLNCQALAHWTADDWRETAEYVASRTIESVLSRFFERADDGRWIHANLDEQKSEFADDHQKRSLGGKMTAEKNRRKASAQHEGECLAECSAPAIQSQSQSQSTHTNFVVDGTNDDNHGSESDFASDGQIAEWAKAYADVDVKAELLRMRQWLKAHPEKRLSRADFARFAVNWLSGEQDKADAVKQRTETAAKIAAEKPSATHLRVQRNLDALDKAAAKLWGIRLTDDHPNDGHPVVLTSDPSCRSLTDSQTIEGQLVEAGPFNPDEMGFFASTFPSVDVRTALVCWQAETDPDALAGLPKTIRQTEFMSYLRKQVPA